MNDEQKKINTYATRAGQALEQAFCYYNYVREFYGYLLDSIDCALEPEDMSFNPSTAPAEKVFTLSAEKNATAIQIARDKITCAIHAYERMIEIVGGLENKEYEQGKEERTFGLQDTHKFALTSITELLFSPSIWHRFDEKTQKSLENLADESRSDVMVMDPLLLEEHISKIFVIQKESLEKFLPTKLEELKLLLADI